MILSISERFVLSMLLTQESDFATLKLARAAQEKLSFTEQEFIDYSLTKKTGNWSWDGKADKGKEIDIGPKMTEYAKDALIRLDKRGKLTDEHFTLYERLVVEQPE